MRETLVIIGTGLAGYMLARDWRKLNTTKKLIMLTQDDGAFYSKPLLSTALTQKKTSHELALKTADQMAAELNADIKTHCRVTKIEPQANTVKTDQGDFQYSQLVLALGADKVLLPLKGEAVHTVRSVNSLVDYHEFRHWLASKQHIGILGVGLVGCEFANDLINSGHKVTMMAPDKQLLPKLVPSKIAAVLQSAFIEQGVSFHLQCFANHVDPVDHQVVVTLSDSSEVVVDGVLAAVGIKPHIKLAQSAGIAVGEGIQVNDQLRTNIANIYALGDCAEVEGQVRQYVAPLLQSARALAHILVEGKKQVDFPCMPIVIKTPSCPIVTVPPAKNIVGEWCYQGEAKDLRAEFYDDKNHLRGFALSGACVKERMALAKATII